MIKSNLVNMQSSLFRRGLRHFLLRFPKHSNCLQRQSVKYISEQNNPVTSTSVKSLNKIALPVYRSAIAFKDKIALKDKHGQYTYERLVTASDKLAAHLIEKLGDVKQQRIALLCPTDSSYIISQWACWLSGHIVVPLSPIHPPAMLEYFIRDSGASLIITTPDYENVVEQCAQKTGRLFLVLDDNFKAQPTVKECLEEVTKSKLLDLAAEQLLDNSKNTSEMKRFSGDDADYSKSIDNIVGHLGESFYRSNNAMIVYTSGSTGQPKGVLISFNNIDAQIRAMVNAWNWSSNDIILHCLPLNHIHGIVNALLSPLAVGARCVMLPSFDASEIWRQVLGVKVPDCDRVNLFMGVPTMYVKLIDRYTQTLAKNERMVDYVRASCSQKMRLFVSGSAPLPTQVFEKWQFITGHKILERYGMTETGMVLTNSLEGNRVPGSIGTPFSGVDVRIVDGKGTVLAEGSSHGTKLSGEKKSVSGELLVRGNNVFQEYYKKSVETKKSFDNGWFKTGDYVNYSNGEYRILGRQSVDIIKTGGYKVSAIHVETALRDHPLINDVAVVGLSDLTWGQKVAAVVETSKDDIDLVELSEWAKGKLPPYEVPTEFRIVKSIPRNHLGKVNKKELVNVVFNKENKTNQ